MCDDAEAKEVARILGKFAQPQDAALRIDEDLLHILLMNLVKRALIEADLEDEEGDRSVH
jgi:hypothetical protein